MFRGRQSQHVRRHLLLAFGEFGNQVEETFGESFFVKPYSNLLIEQKEFLLDQVTDSLCLSQPKMEPRRKFENYCLFKHIDTNLDYVRMMNYSNVEMMELVYTRNPGDWSLKNIIEKYSPSIELLNISCDRLPCSIPVLIESINKCTQLSALTIELFNVQNVVDLSTNLPNLSKLKDFNLYLETHSVNLLKALGRCSVELYFAFRLRSNQSIDSEDIDALLSDEFNEEFAQATHELPYLIASTEIQLREFFNKFKNLRSMSLLCTRIQSLASLVEILQPSADNLQNLKLINVSTEFLHGIATEPVALQFTESLSLSFGNNEQIKDHSLFDRFPFGSVFPLLKQLTIEKLPRICNACGVNRDEAVCKRLILENLRQNRFMINI